jgi:hypothetical protein
LTFLPTEKISAIPNVFDEILMGRIVKAPVKYIKTSKIELKFLYSLTPFWVD